MRVHTHKQNQDSHRQVSRLWHLWLYDARECDVLSVDVQGVHARRPQAEFGARIHLGTRGSETPLDAHLTVAGTGVYVSVGAPWLRRACHVLTRGEGRDVSLAMYGGSFWWSLWTNEDHRCNSRGKHRPWLCRRGSAPVNPLDLVLGPTQYQYEDVDTAVGEVVLPEGTYPVELTLQRVTRGRRNGRRRRYQHMSVDWNATGGIPWMYDHSGGWKGTGVYGSAVLVPDDVEGKDWASVAVAKIAAAAVESRVRTGWTPEHEESVR